MAGSSFSRPSSIFTRRVSPLDCLVLLAAVVIMSSCDYGLSPALISVISADAAHLPQTSRSLLQSVAPLTFLPSSATKQGAVCIDGTAPAYSIDYGSGSGQNNWIVHLQGGGWCGTLSDCLQRSSTNLGSSNYMYASGFGGLLSGSSSVNPDFYNWNRVHVRYCDGGSFLGDTDATVQQNGQTTYLHFRGKKIWEAVIDDLLGKGLGSANKAILSGDSAGGLAALYHCDRFQQKVSQASVKCLSDGGFFVNIPNIGGAYSFQELFENVVALHKITSLPGGCGSQSQCFFPQYQLGSIKTPVFILQSPYDSFEVRYVLAPPASYSNGGWDGCRNDLSSCSSSQLSIVQDQLKGKTLATLKPLVGSRNWGMFLPSCYYHTMSGYDGVWNGKTQVNGENAASAFRRWYFGGSLVQDIDCAYPCNPTCVGIPS